MKIMPSLKFILAVFLCTCLLSPVYAQVNDELVNYLCEYAQRLYAQGDLEGAKHEFRKVLIVNPANATAKSYLKKMGVDNDRIISTEPVFKNKINVYDDQINTLQKSLDVKNKELADLKRGQELERALSDRAQSAQVQKLTFDKEAQIRKLENQAKTLDTFIANELAQYKNKREALEISLQAKDKEIAGLNENLKLQREQLFSKDNILSNVNNTLQAKDKELTDINNALKLQEGQLTHKDAVIQDKDNQIADRENALGARDNQIQALKSQISAQELEKQMIIDAGKSPLNQLVEYKAKLDSMESALGARDKEIAGLNENLKLQREQLFSKDNILSNVNNTLQAKDNQIARLNDELANQAKNQESIVKNAEVLDAGLSEVKNKLVQAERLILDKDQQIATLTNQVKELNNQLGEAKNRIAQAEKLTLDKNGELNALTGRLKELDAQLAEEKNKLAQAEKSALDKSNELSSRLTEAERLTLDKDKENLDKDKQIKALQEQLSQLASSYAAQLAEGQDKAFKLRNILRLKDKKSKALKKEVDAAGEVTQLKDTMEKLKKSLQVEIETYKAKLESAKKGIVVTVLADILFNSGSAEVTSGGRDILSKISAGLKGLPADYQIVIEGHTDNEPIGYSGWKSNWELSTGRALSVLHYLVGKCGLNEEVFSVSGYGELRPVADNATERGQRQNRRVEIVINPPKVIKVKASELTE